MVLFYCKLILFSNIGACESFGKPQYLTFDRRNFTFDGKCAYTVVKDTNIGKDLNFQIYAVHDKCPTDKKSACTSALYFIINNHTLHVQKIKNEVSS